MEIAPADPVALTKSSRAKRILTNPWFGGISAVASIISLPLAIYMFISGQAHPGLTMFVHPVRTAVVKAGDTSGLKVLLNGIETGPDVTAAQIAVWNDGKAPIRNTSVLEVVRLTLEPRFKILDARIGKRSRSATGFKITTENESGTLGLQWHILEPGDGAVIQVLYDGPASQGNFTLQGTIEGQRSFALIAPKEKTKTSEGEVSPVSEGWSMFLACAVAIALGLNLTHFTLRQGRQGRMALMISASGGAVASLGYFIYQGFLRVTTPYPPFGF